MAVGSLLCRTFDLNILVWHPRKVLVPPVICPSSFHVIAIIAQSVCQMKSGLICLVSISSCHFRMVVAWALFFIQQRRSWPIGVPVRSVRMGSVAVILKVLLDVLPSFASWSAWLLDWLLL